MTTQKVKFNFQGEKVMVDSMDICKMFIPTQYTKYYHVK